MLKRMNTDDRMHLFYLIDHDVEEEIYSGLAHVAEHTCLAKDCEHTRDRSSWGCTCLSHMYLYFESKCDIGWIDSLKEQMKNNSIITKDKVEIAKMEVIEESRVLSFLTNKRQRIVRFISEDRITSFAMGNPSEIERIKLEDVVNFWDYLCRNHHIYEIQYKSKADVDAAFKDIISTVSQTNNKLIIENRPLDEYLILSEGELCRLDIYFQLPLILHKKDFIAKALIEYYLKEIFIDHLDIIVDINDKYFSKTEKYVVVTSSNVPHKRIKTLLSDLRNCIVDYADSTSINSSYPKFRKLVLYAMKQENAIDLINKYKNYIIYKHPIISQPFMLEHTRINYDIAYSIDYLLKSSAKIVVTSAKINRIEV